MRRLLPALALGLLMTAATPAMGAGFTWTYATNPCAIVAPVDVLFLFDTTGSMGGVLNSAKSGATSIMNSIRSQVPNSWFGAANYRDYNGFYSYPGYASQYGSTGDYPWQVNGAMSSSTAATQAAINGITLGYGADGPESLVRALYESYAAPNLGWRAGSIRIVIVFADAPGHDLNFGGFNFGGDPGRDAIAQNGDDLNFETVVANLAATGTKVGFVQSGSWNAATSYFDYTAAQTGGIRENLGGSFVVQVTNMVLNLLNPQPALTSHAFALDVDTSFGGLRESDTSVSPFIATATDQLGSIVNLPAGLGWVRILGSDSANTGGVKFAGASGAASVEEVSLLGGLVYAQTLKGQAQASIGNGGAGSASFGTTIARLVVNGQVVVVPASGSTVIPLPAGLGYLAVNEGASSAGSRSAWAWVNALHLVTPVAEVIIGHGFASATCKAPIGDFSSPAPPRPLCVQTPAAPVCAPRAPALPALPVIGGLGIVGAPLEGEPGPADAARAAPPVAEGAEEPDEGPREN